MRATSTSIYVNVCTTYGITELETLAVVWAVTHFQTYLYANSVRIYTDHSGVKAVLLAPNPSGKYARWWNRVYWSGIQEGDIVYRPGKQSANADGLSRSPLPGRTTGVVEERDSEPLVGAVKSETSSASENISKLLSTVSESPTRTLSFAEEQKTLTSVRFTSSWRNSNYQRTPRQQEGLLFRHLCLQCQTKYCTSLIQSQSIVDGLQSRSIYARTCWTRPIEAEWEGTSQDKDCTMPSPVIGGGIVCILMP